MTLKPGALSLILVAGLCWSTLDALRKRLVREVEPSFLLLLMAASQVPLFGAWAVVAGWGSGGRWVPDANYWAPALCSIGLNVAANLAFFHAMRRAPLSATVPLLSLTPAFTTLLGVPLLGERPTAVQAAGVLLVVAGALVLHPGLLSRLRGRGAPLESGGQAGGTPPGAAADRLGALPGAAADRLGALPGAAADRLGALPAAADRSGALPAAVDRSGALPAAVLMGLTAVSWSLSMPLDKLAVEHAGAPIHGLVLNAGVAVGVLLVGLAGRVVSGPPAGRESWGAGSRVPRGVLAAAMVVSFLAMSLQLLALSQAPAGFVETVKRGMGNASAVVVGGALFGERVGGRTLAAVLMMAAGVAAILL